MLRRTIPRLRHRHGWSAGCRKIIEQADRIRMRSTFLESSKSRDKRKEEEDSMTETRTERGSCKFTVQQVEGGKQALIVQTFHGTISPLRAATLGFSLLSTTSPEQAKSIAEMLNEYVLEAFVTISDSHPMYEK
jgi:hypothetical protein